MKGFWWISGKPLVVKGHSGDEEDFLCFGCGALKRGSHGFACFGLDDLALRRYLLALRSALEETRKCIYLLLLRSARGRLACMFACLFGFFGYRSQVRGASVVSSGCCR
jgi:hypothetical protein